MPGYRDPLFEGQQGWDQGEEGEVRTTRPLPKVPEYPGKGPRGQGLFRVRARASSSLWTPPCLQGHWSFQNKSPVGQESGRRGLSVGWGQSLTEGGRGCWKVPGLCSLDDHPCLLFLQWLNPYTFKTITSFETLILLDVLE